MFSPTKLKEKRESQGLSQSQLASSLGISRASYFNWESGKTKPNQNNLSKLSEIFNVDPRYFESEYEIVETYLKLTTFILKFNFKQQLYPFSSII